MKLGIDIDGVLYDFDGHVREQAPYMGLPHALTPEQEEALLQPSPRWNYLPDVLGKANWDWFWSNQDKLESYLSSNDYGRKHWEALAKLTTRHETYLVTNRPAECRYQTYIWVASEYPKTQLQGIIHADDKVKTAMGLSLDVLVDDRPSQLQKYGEWAKGHHERVWLYGVRRPWNESHTSIYPGFKWVDGVADLLKEPWA